MNSSSAAVNKVVMARFANVTNRARATKVSNGRLALGLIAAAALLGLLTGCSSQSSTTATSTTQARTVSSVAKTETIAVTPAPVPAEQTPAGDAPTNDTEAVAPVKATPAKTQPAAKAPSTTKKAPITTVTVDADGVTRYPTLQPKVEATSSWYAPTPASIGAAWGLGTPTTMFKDGAIYDNGSSITVVGLYGGPWRAMDLNDITGYTVKASSLGGHLVTVSCANGTTFQLTWGTTYDAVSHPPVQVWRARTTVMTCNA